MNAHQMTSSAALYFRPEANWSVPWQWLERVRGLFAEFNLSPILFSAADGGFLIDECYVLAERGADLVIWDELRPARGADLVSALRNGAIRSLAMDSPRPGAEWRSEWRAKASISSTFWRYYIGIDDGLISDPAALLRRAFDMSRDILHIGYGIAYNMPLADDPACYAIGKGATSISEAFDMIRHRHDWDSRQKSADELWGDELNGQQRHLSGLFRGAYPASILSDSHVRAAELVSCNVGKLSQLDGLLWLWELSPADVPRAQRILEAHNVLLSQAPQQ